MDESLAQNYDKVEQALALVSRRNGWTQTTESRARRSFTHKYDTGGEEEITRGEEVEPDIYNPDHLSFCAVGAIRAVADYTVGCQLIDLLNEEAHEKYGLEHVYEVNDGEDIRRDEVSPVTAKKRVIGIYQSVIRKMKAAAGVEVKIPETVEVEVPEKVVA